MAGGRRIRDDNPRSVSTANIFTALESRRKKPLKKSFENGRQDLEGSALRPSDLSIPEPAVLSPSWSCTPVSVISWADCEEDDDDYFALPVLPPLPALVDDLPQQSAEEQGDQSEEEASDEESEECNDLEEENENKEPPVCIANESVTCLSPRKEPHRQISKKELKKKAMADLEATLSELGLNQTTEEDPCKNATVVEAANDDYNRQDTKSSSLSVSKSSKKWKAKKERSSSHGVERPMELNEAVAEHQDKGELLKKLSSARKKKSKNGDSVAKAAVAEAGIRAAKLAAARKKEKNHYNQQPR